MLMTLNSELNEARKALRFLTEQSGARAPIERRRRRYPHFQPRYVSSAAFREIDNYARMAKTIDVTTESDATNSTTNEKAAHIEYSFDWAKPRKPNGAVHPIAPITDGATIKFSAKQDMCWYLDSTFCAGFHSAEAASRSAATTASAALERIALFGPPTDI